MPTIRVIQKDGSEKVIEAESGNSLMNILRDAEFEAVEGVCDGAMACATCHVYVHPDWADKIEEEGEEKTEDEEDILDMAFDIEDASRLGCQIRMSDKLDGIIVAIPGAKIDW